MLPLGCVAIQELRAAPTSAPQLALIDEGTVMPDGEALGAGVGVGVGAGVGVAVGAGVGVAVGAGVGALVGVAAGVGAGVALTARVVRVWSEETVS